MGPSNAVTTKVERPTPSTRHGAKHVRERDGKNESQENVRSNAPHPIIYGASTF